MASYYCYIVECADGTFYTGWSTDPERRTRTHNAGRGAKYTRQHGPVKLVYVESVPDRGQAMRRENAIKALSRPRKQRLIHDSPFSVMSGLETVNQEENHQQSGQNPDSESL